MAACNSAWPGKEASVFVVGGGDECVVLVVSGRSCCGVVVVGRCQDLLFLLRVRSK